MTTVRRSLWAEPRPPDIPPVSRLDRVLIVGLEAAVLLEGFIRPGLAWRPLVTVLAAAAVAALLWHRTRPLLAVLVGFGAAGVLALVEMTAHTGELGLYSMMVVLILLYELVRWGSGREIVVGLSFVAAVVVLGMFAASAGAAEVLGGTAFLLLFVALAAVFRYRAALWQRGQLEVRNQERLALARELHDTVAHHVSAIAVQSQAGRVVADSQPQQATKVLAAIEAEASRTLAEMRSMVRVLREDEGAAYAPHRGVADLPVLAHADTAPAVEVCVADSVTHLTPPVDAAIYRLAQEAVTNARRHARGATLVDIDVRREGDLIRLRICDDGHTVQAPSPNRGFGLTGMAERAQILGGTLTAGPGSDGGWVVDAAFPARGPA